MNVKETRQKIVALLESTKRQGMDALIHHLDTTDFFMAPASTRFHGCFQGGLAEHSLRVFELPDESFKTLNLAASNGNGQKPLPLVHENIIIAALLHDVCKIGAYLGDAKPYKWNRQQPKGHATLSIQRIKAFIKLDPIEEMMIRYHMGVYGVNEFYDEKDWQSGEYPLRSDHSQCENMTKEESKEARYGQSLANAWYHNPVVKMIYFCDEISTLEAKANETA